MSTHARRTAAGAALLILVGLGSGLTSCAAQNHGPTRVSENAAQNDGSGLAMLDSKEDVAAEIFTGSPYAAKMQ